MKEIKERIEKALELINSMDSSQTEISQENFYKIGSAELHLREALTELKSLEKSKVLVNDLLDIIFTEVEKQDNG